MYVTEKLRCELAQMFIIVNSSTAKFAPLRRMIFDPEKFFFDSMPSRGEYSASFETVKCTCQREIKSEDWSSHWSEEPHASRSAALEKVKASERILHRRRKEAVAWKAHVSSLNRAHWRSELYRKMVEYVTDCTVESTEVTIPLEKYELIERVDLLDLAVWKATCVLSPPQNATFAMLWSAKPGWARAGK
jgi:hypothetical protein